MRSLGAMGQGSRWTPHWPRSSNCRGLQRGAKSFLLLRFPEAHHPAVGIGEKGKGPHARNGLLLNADLAAGGDNLFAVRGQVVDRDVAGRHVARLWTVVRRLPDAAVDPHAAP